MSRPPSRVPSYAQPTASSKARSHVAPQTAVDKPRPSHSQDPLSTSRNVSRSVPATQQADRSRTLPTQARSQPVIKRAEQAERTAGFTARKDDGKKGKQMAKSGELRSMGLLFSSPANQDVLLELLRVVRRKDIFAIQKACTPSVSYTESDLELITSRSVETRGGSSETTRRSRSGLPVTSTAV